MSFTSTVSVIVGDCIKTVEREHETVVMLTKLLWGEYRGANKDKQAAVIWCVLNRVDAGWGTIQNVVTAPNQFTGYRESNPVDEELLQTVIEVLWKWRYCDSRGRTIPSDYLWFWGDSKDNYFRNTWEDTGVYWQFD